MKHDADRPAGTDAGSIRRLIRSALRSKSGSSSVEMGLICSLIVLAMMTALQNFASASLLTWNAITSASTAATSQPASG